MKYYSTWQEAFIDYINRYGQDFEDSYNLGMAFEQDLKQNTKGTYYLYFGD